MTDKLHLCDTNIISELARPKPNAGVITWISSQTTLRISVITLEEIRYGLAWRPKPKIERWFDSFLQTRCEILPITPEIAHHAGQLRGQLASKGRVHGQADILIASTAAIHNYTIVTRNVKDFENCGIDLFNPFT
ncbi:MAG: type II toxin-antitoxin system VapC family toxin [Chloroflexota bacterium]